MSYSDKNKNIRGSSYETPSSLINPNQPNLYTTQQVKPPNAETIMVECNRATSIQTEDGLNSDYHRWTCEFPNGIQLRTGDEVRVNSAYLSSIGVGDLIAWDKSGDSQNNKCRWLHSFYCSNDGKNDKREGYNIKTGKGIWEYDIDNRPAQLERVINKYDFTTSTRTDAYKDFGWSEDPYCPMRFFGLNPKLEPPYLKNATGIPPNSGPSGAEQPEPDKVFWIEIENVGGTEIQLKAYYINDVTATYPTGKTQIASDDLFTLGQSFRISAPLPLVLTGDVGTGNTFFDGALVTNGNNVLGTFTVIDINTVTGYVVLEDLTDIIVSGQKLEGAGKIQAIQRIMKTQLVVGTGAYKWFATGINNSSLPIEDIDYALYEFKNIGGSNAVPVEGIATKLQDVDGEDITAKFLSSDYSREFSEGIQVINNAVGGNINSIQIQFDNISFNSINNLLGFQKYNNCISFKIERDNNTFEYITAYILKGQNNGNRSGTITYISDTTFQFDKVRRNIEAPNFEPIAHTPINNGNNLWYNPEIGTERTYKLNLTKKQRYTLSQGYGLIPPPTDNQKIYYGFIGIPTGVYSNTYTITYNETDIFNGVSNAYQIGGNLITDINFQQIGYIEDELDNTTLPHYEYFDFQIDDEYSSPSDVATDLTKQTHKLYDARNKDGSVLDGTDNQGLLQNKLCIPVWTSFDATNTEDHLTGELEGQLEEGSFLLKHSIYKLPIGISNSTGTPTPTTDYPENGETNIYFRTKYTTRNRPTDHTHTYDFYQNAYEQYSEIKNQDDVVTGFPIQYIEGEECYASQYCGTNNLTFSWDATDSRFNISYAHQPHISTFSTDANGNTTGGQVSAVVYYPSPVGKDNYRYKLPRTRCGGINIENWVATNYNVGDLTPQQVLVEFPKLTFTELTDDNFWGVGSSSLNNDIVGERFWTKLGFSKSFRDSKTGWKQNITSNQRNPLGTTDNLLDVADNILFTEEASEDTPFYTSNDNFAGDGTNVEAKWKYASRGGLFTNNHNKGYGLPNTSGRPTEFIGVNTATGSDYDPLKSTFNPDRNWWNATGYTVETESNTITADVLPTKTELGYYFIISDIIKSNFFVSKGGGEVNILGTLSKLNSSGDFVFQYQAPQVFYAKQDRLLTSITTEIRTPSLDIPVALSPYSSVIYQIVRYAPQPTPLELPVWYRQQLAFNQIDANIKMVAKQEGKEPVQEQVNNIMEEVLNAVNQPTDEQSTLMESLVEEYNRLELSQYRNNPRDLRNFIRTNPDAEGFLRRLEATSSQHERTGLTYEQLREQAFSLYPRGEISNDTLGIVNDATSFEPLERDDMELDLLGGFEGDNTGTSLPSFEERRASQYRYDTTGRQGREGSRMDRNIVDTELELRRRRIQPDERRLGGYEGEEPEEEPDKDKDK